MAHSGAKRKQEEAIAALLTQGTIEKAAVVAEISPRTLYRWLQTPEFQAANRRARRDAFSQAMARLQQASSVAATVLWKVMVDSNTPASVRVRAAECILNHALKATALEAIQSGALEADGEKSSPAEVRTELCGLLRPVGKTLHWRNKNPGVTPDANVVEPLSQASDHLQ